jgi:Domain of unknown function (DUF4166)/Saccharopine dehydrogenase NADP binding domain
LSGDDSDQLPCPIDLSTRLAERAAEGSDEVKAMKVLILGGYGTFGGRLAQLVGDLAPLDLVIAGRDLAKAEAFCVQWRGLARVVPAQVDRADITLALSAHRPDILVDASGPFQDYGPDRYVVLRACIAAGVHYLDLADGADFVAGVAGFDAAARQAGVYVLSGVSSFPVLTAAVLQKMSQGMQVYHVTGGIAPSPYAGVGLNVMRAVLGYAGSKVALLREGKPATGMGLGETRRYTIAPPGELPLRNTLFSLVDVPDLRVIPPTMPGLESLWIGAGPVPEVLHRLLILLARARAVLRLPRLTPLAPLCFRVLNAARFGEHRGGMFIEVDGSRDGLPVTRSWHLLAEGDDGPFIPSMAIEAILRAALAGKTPPAGARPGIGALTLADYDAVFAGRAIRTGWREDLAVALYPRLLDTAFATLPPMLQALHQPGRSAIWSGRADIQRGKGWAADLVARLFRFPKAGREVPVTVTFTTNANKVETWERRFAGSVMRSTQEVGKGRNQHLLVERFGPFAFGLALVWRDDRLTLCPRRWSVLGIPLPHTLMPRGDTYEAETAGKFRFHVEITLPLIGAVVRYTGWLLPDQTPA